MRDMKQSIGIDAGGTLIKIAHETPDGAVRFLKFRSDDLEGAAAWLLARGDDAAVALTGGKAKPLQALIGRPASYLVEFEATCSGVRWLMRQGGMEQASFLLTNVGTGTSIHYVDGERHTRIGGTGVGGGTLVGLSAMTTGVREFDEIVRLASTGKRDDIDLLVSHIYEGSTPPIPGELTASNFGRWLQTGGSDRPEDVLASIVGLVGETVASVSVHAAGQCGASCVLYIGSSFIRNDLLRKVVAGYTELRGSRAVMVPDGEYSGALGALLSLKTGEAG
ncbi:type II pantothenate kinase [Paenibacillus sp.]|uniref:type II pantothenate kinase n=1 Tax=Paenibacillus sp. TaxID=58172 RepID=UPI00281265C1|nr:type II pantothenate kinase [Paenibacillus sp.]